MRERKKVNVKLGFQVKARIEKKRKKVRKRK